MRKLLQLSDKDTCVLADSVYAYGLGSAFSADDAVHISITGHASTVSIWFCRVDMLELTASILGGKPPVYG